ncbi:MAG: diacylglycerol kinase family lipid kinase [Devosia sp.]|nr:diacylglycerol kinase family lipid kinase [Devosia sp.]
MHVVGVFNRDGGTFKTIDMALFVAHATEVFAAHGHTLDARVVEGKDLIEELNRAATEAEVLLAGGGDGTVSAAAAVAYKRDIPLAVLPAGTMNLFARSLKLPLDLNEALEAVASGETRNVDIATANGRPFIHQFSVGIHPKLVRLRETLSYKGRIGKMIASTRAAAGVILSPPRFKAEIRTPKGLERRSTAGISISNNPLQEGHIPHAEGLDAGLLGIYVVKPLSPWVLAKLSWAVVRGTWKNMPEVIDKEAKEVSISFPRKTSSAVAVIDGELISLDQRVDLKIHPGALKVIVPKSTAPDAVQGAAERLTPA